jgi:hypothetical protein
LDFKTSYNALKMGRVLLGTLATVADQNQAAPLLDWLQATCVRFRPNAVDPTQ